MAQAVVFTRVAIEAVVLRAMAVIVLVLIIGQVMFAVRAVLKEGKWQEVVLFRCSGDYEDCFDWNSLK